MLFKPNFWDKKSSSLLSVLFFPLTIFVFLRNFFSKFIKKNKYKIKLICIGNIYLGGTGKTPLTIKIFKILNNLNIKTVILKKFYSNHIDEQKLLKLYGPLITSKSRSKIIKKSEKMKFKIGIFDDGLQEKGINFDLKIVCFDKKNFLGNGNLIPSGPLRESINSIKDNDIIFFNGVGKIKTEYKSLLKKINKKIKIFETVPFVKNINEINLKNNYLVFCGIGNPENFRLLLKKNKIKIFKFLDFPDHYNYSKSDMNFIYKTAKEFNLKILTTEKDYFRIKNKKNIKPVKIELSIKNENKFVNELKKIL